MLNPLEGIYPIGFQILEHFPTLSSLPVFHLLTRKLSVGYLSSWNQLMLDQEAIFIYLLFDLSYKQINHRPVSLIVSRKQLQSGFITFFLC